MFSEILILGGTNYVGKSLLYKLLKENRKVSIISRSCHKVKDHPNLEKINGERILILPSLKNREWEVVYDQTCYSLEDAELSCLSFNGKIGTYIFTSSQAVYPAGKNLCESDYNPYDLNNFHKIERAYNYAKRQAEAVFYQKAYFPVTTVRFPIILGKNNPNKRFQSDIELILKTNTVSVENLEARLSLIDSTDAANFLYWLHNKKYQGPINACSLGSICLKDFIKHIELYAKTPLHINEVKYQKYSQHPYLVHSAWEKDRRLLSVSISNHWYMDQSQALQMGYKFHHTHDWLPSYLKDIVHDSSS